MDPCLESCRPGHSGQSSSQAAARCVVAATEPRISTIMGRTGHTDGWMSPFSLTDGQHRAGSRCTEEAEHVWLPAPLSPALSAAARRSSLNDTCSFHTC